MAKRYEVRLTGTGGQGLITAGIILAEAAIYDGNDAVQTQSYGAEARGGASKAEVVISKDSISYPKVTVPDILLAMSQEAYTRYAMKVKEDSITIIDSYYVDELFDTPGISYLLPITDTAIATTGRDLAANVVAVGAIASLLGVVSYESVKTAVLGRVPKGTEEVNLRCLQAGFRLGEEAREQDRQNKRMFG